MEATNSIRNLVDHIDANFLQGKISRISRYSVEWGKWSRAMNLEIRKRIEAHDTDSLALKYIFQYWLNRSQLLEVYHKSKFGKVTLKHRLAKNGSQLKSYIFDKNAPELGDWKDMVTKIVE